MSNITIVGNWIFEEKLGGKQFFARKSKAYGGDYIAAMVITIIEGTPKIELFINKNTDTFTRQDYRDFQEFFTLSGFESASFDRYKKGVKKGIAKNISR